MTDPTEHKTLGITSFARCGQDNQALLRINPHIPLTDALAHASNLQNCADKLSLDAAMGEGEHYAAWAAHYLGEMAKAIIDDATAALSNVSSASRVT